MRQVLVASVHDTLLALLGEGKELGAKPGIIATRHPWTQTLRLPPPRHCLVTGGGLTAAGQWEVVQHGCLLPMRGIMALCRGTLLAALRQGVAHSTLTLPAGQRQQHVEHLLNTLGRQKLTVHLRERYASGQGGLRSLARYLGGWLLSNRRLHACDGPEVVFG